MLKRIKYIGLGIVLVFSGIVFINLKSVMAETSIPLVHTVSITIHVMPAGK